jgi:hypothetical protein
MKRVEIIKRLISEGFSEKTLVNFSDNQLVKLSNKILGEGLQVKADYLKKDPTLVDKLKDKNVTVVPEEVDVEETEKPKKVKKSLDLTKLNEFVETAVGKQFHNMTTKSEIVSLIKERLNESNTEISEKFKGKLPEFMSFDNIVSAGEKEAPEKDAPEVDAPPRENPGTDSPELDPRRSPFRNPNEEPAVDPNPKAKIKKLKSMPTPMAAAAE